MVYSQDIADSSLENAWDIGYRDVGLIVLANQIGGTGPTQLCLLEVMC